MLHSLAPKRENPRTVLLTPGPYNETYFEHAFLAQYLGYTLVEGGDLTVRNSHIFLKTLGGLAFGWLDFDPTNNVMPHANHVTIALGRDYSDVAPVNGVAIGGGEQMITVSVEVLPATGVPA